MLFKSYDLVKNPVAIFDNEEKQKIVFSQDYDLGSLKLSQARKLNSSKSADDRFE